MSIYSRGHDPLELLRSKNNSKLRCFRLATVNRGPAVGLVPWRASRQTADGKHLTEFPSREVPFPKPGSLFFSLFLPLDNIFEKFLKNFIYYIIYKFIYNIYCFISYNRFFKYSSIFWIKSTNKNSATMHSRIVRYFIGLLPFSQKHFQNSLKIGIETLRKRVQSHSAFPNIWERYFQAVSCFSYFRISW